FGRCLGGGAGAGPFALGMEEQAGVSTPARPDQLPFPQLGGRSGQPADVCHLCTPLMAPFGSSLLRLWPVQGLTSRSSRRTVAVCRGRADHAVRQPLSVVDYPTGSRAHSEDTFGYGDLRLPWPALLARFVIWLTDKPDTVFTRCREARLPGRTLRPAR